MCDVTIRKAKKNVKFDIHIMRWHYTIEKFFLVFKIYLICTTISARRYRVFV